MSRPPPDAPGIAAIVGIAAIGFSALYFVSDLIELGQGRFSTLQLVLTYASEAAIPLFVIGLYTLQRPQIGRLGLVGALAYAYAFVFFTSTVVYALIDHTGEWDTLKARFGAWITIHSLVMVLAGLAFGYAVVRAQVLSRWSGVTLIVGMALMAATTSLPGVIRTASAGVRDAAFAAMGASLLGSQHTLLTRQPTAAELTEHGPADPVVNR